MVVDDNSFVSATPLMGSLRLGCERDKRLVAFHSSSQVASRLVCPRRFRKRCVCLTYPYIARVLRLRLVDIA